MKQVLSVQDLSCVGKCSLTVALPVLSAMGCACSVLPTAVLSTHTGFPSPHVRSLTEDMDGICRHWQQIDLQFDGICVGYLSDPAQAARVEQVMDAFPATVVLDPVMGDHGKLYSRITDAHVQAVKNLCCRCDVLLPNITEASFLTGLPYKETGDLSYFQQLISGLTKLGAKNVVLTGVSLGSGQTGFLLSDGQLYQTQTLPGCFHGTGDLFAAVFTGGYVRGRSLYDAAVLAARFVEQVIAGAEPTPLGVTFEPHLGWLAQQCEK